MNPRTTSSAGFSLLEMLVTIVMLGVILGVVGQTVLQVQDLYPDQRRKLEAQSNARTALDLMTRLFRMAGNNPRQIPGLVAVGPDPDANGELDSIRIQADWNLPDGALNDPYEDVTFTTNGSSLFIQEPGNAAPIEFLGGISHMGFQYFDAEGVAVTNPIATPAKIVSMDIVLTCNIPDSPAFVFRSSATARGRE